MGGSAVTARIVGLVSSAGVAKSVQPAAKNTAKATNTT